MKSLLTKIAIVSLIAGVVGYGQINRTNDTARPQNGKTEGSQAPRDARQNDRQADRNGGESTFGHADVKPIFSLGSIASPPEPEKNEKAKPAQTE